MFYVNFIFNITCQNNLKILKVLKNNWTVVQNKNFNHAKQNKKKSSALFFFFFPLVRLPFCFLDEGT